MKSHFYCILTLIFLATSYYFYQATTTPLLQRSEITPEVLHVFRNWMQEHKKQYDSYGEFQFRLMVFKEMYEFVKNFKSSTMAVGLNFLSDITAEELKANYLGEAFIEFPESQSRPTREEATIPDSVDWRENPAITPVQDQGQCGSCWAFAATETLSSVYALALKDQNLYFSPQELVDCAQSYDNNGCNGGMAFQAFNYTQVNGITTNAAYPYTAKNGKCHIAGTPRYYPNNKGYVKVLPFNQTDLKQSIALNPTAVSIEADQKVFQSYTSGVLTDGCGNNLDHAVVAVGYTPDYVIIQNSWGTSWGQKGYINLAWATDACGFMTRPYYPVY